MSNIVKGLAGREAGASRKADAHLPDEELFSARNILGGITNRSDPLLLVKVGTEINVFVIGTPCLLRSGCHWQLLL